MLINKKFIVITCLLGVATFSALTSMKADHDEHEGFANLKVLPKHIPHEALHQLMDDWSHALGVRCGFCHARTADNKPDFASDAKPEKNMARAMFKMTAKINNKYFEGKKDSLGLVMGDIKCITCHHGSPHPDEVKEMGGGDMHPGAPGAGK